MNQAALSLSSVAPTYLNSSECNETMCLKCRILSVVYIIVLIVGITANALALYVFIKLIHKRTASTIIMVNLATSDLFFSFTLPIRIIYYLKDGQWELNNILCRFSTYAFYLNMYTSIFFLMTLSIFRYIAVTREIMAKGILTVRRATIIAIVIWVIVASVTSPVLFLGSSSNGHHCFEIKNLTVKNTFIHMNYVAMVGFALPFLIIIVCYVCIIHHLRASGNQSPSNGKSIVLKFRRLRRNSRSIALAVIVLLVFLFCFLPYHIQRTLYLHREMNNKNEYSCNDVNTINILTMCLAVSNCCIDPLIYYFLAGKFRSILTVSRTRNTATPLSRKP